MEKLAKYLSYIVEGNLDYIPEDSANLLANESKKLCIEFANWCMENSQYIEREQKFGNLHTQDEIFDAFINQYKF